MTEEQFTTELWIRAFIDQVAGYPFGHPKRQGFEPRVPMIRNADGSIDRQRTLDLPCFQRFTAEQHAQMLQHTAIATLERSLNK